MVSCYLLGLDSLKGAFKQYPYVITDASGNAVIFILEDKSYIAGDGFPKVIGRGKKFTELQPGDEFLYSFQDVGVRGNGVMISIKETNEALVSRLIVAFNQYKEQSKKISDQARAQLNKYKKELAEWQACELEKIKPRV